ncbi:unnamed protein product [Urochloa decumbens]|uniref:Aminotransferase-like plant mobile domain-containing protein n=1 Tax=Urochloa decumbens TaxID=240449 RepID=A0ABC8XYW5_9POAL
MTVTLEDVAMILGLPIDGKAVTGNIAPNGWKDRVEALVGQRPPDVPEGTKDRRTTGVSAGWLAEHFGHQPPPGAAEDLVERYARAWLWHMLAGFLFPDGSGNTVSWMWLDAISEDWELLRDYSWGSATLAWLYRQLCEACRRTADNSNLGGCALLLQIWMWERIPVARPNRGPPDAWLHNDEDSLPTVAFLWKNIVNVYGGSMRRYIDYSNELDCLLPSHVTWRPYERDELEHMELSPLYTQDKDMWRAEVPLICYYLVEYHLPSRVSRQFGYLQHIPTEQQSTSQELHKIDRRSQRGAKNWADKHSAHIHNWNNHHNFVLQGGAVFRERHYNEVYLRWLRENSRLKLRVAMTSHNIEDLPSDPEDAIDPYDLATRTGTQPERAPIEDYLGQQLAHFSNEAGHALAVPFGSPEAESTLRGFLEGVADVPSRSARHGSATRSSSRTTTARGDRRSGSLTIGSPRGSRATRVGSPSSSRGKQTAVHDSEDEDDDDDEDNESDNSEAEDPSYDIIGTSQLADAPSPTQPSQGTPQKRRARRRDHTDVVSGNVLPTAPGRPRRMKKPFTPNPTPRP